MKAIYALRFSQININEKIFKFFDVCIKYSLNLHLKTFIK